MIPRTVMMLTLLPLFLLAGCDGGSDHAHDADGNHVGEAPASSGHDHGDGYHEHSDGAEHQAHERPETEAYYGDDSDLDHHHDDHGHSHDGHGHDHDDDHAHDH